MVLRATSAATRATMDLGATSSPRRPVASIGYVIRPAMARWPAVLVTSVRVRPASGTTVIIGGVHVRSMPGPTVLIATVIGSTSARSNDSFTREHPRALGSSNPRLAAVY
jgi:hypothetical protein